MNNDGWGFTGAGTNDLRQGGMDLQHNVQTRTADEWHMPTRVVRQTREGGGPMKEHMNEMSHEGHHKSHMHHHLEEEKARHEEAMEHHKHHLEKHHSRDFNSQHGHETHKG